MRAVQAVEHAASISVEGYLAGELKSEMRHEYIGGLVYAMAETSKMHNILVAQDQIEVTVFRRANHWRPEVANRPQQPLRVEIPGFTLPLSDIYPL